MSHGAARLFPEPLLEVRSKLSPSISAPRARPTSRSERASSQSVRDLDSVDGLA